MEGRQSVLRKHRELLFSLGRWLSLAVFPTFDDRLADRTPIAWAEERADRIAEARAEAIQRGGLTGVAVMGATEELEKRVAVFGEQMHQNFRQVVAQLGGFTTGLEGGARPKGLNTLS